MNLDIATAKRVLKSRRVTLTQIVNRCATESIVHTHELAAALNEVERAAVDLALAEQRAGTRISDPNDRS